MILESPSLSYGEYVKANGRDGIETAFGRRYTFSLEYDEAVIEEATAKHDRPEEYCGNKNVKYEVGEKISGKKVWGSSDKRLGRIKKGLSGERSGRHSRQTVEIQGKECYAEIITSWTAESIEIHPLEYIKLNALQKAKTNIVNKFSR